MKVEPLFDRLVILPNKNKNIANCGLMLPDISKEKPQTGDVVSVGSCVEHIEVGDHVLFNRFAGVEVEIENETYVVLKEVDVLGVIDGSEEN